jgi:isopenicillin-N N-acyltransferase-like protein
MSSVDRRRSEGTMFPQISVSGSAYGRGHAYGQQARDRVLRSIAAYAETFEYFAGWDWQRSRAEARRYLPAIDDFAPSQVDELRGIADGAGVELDDVLAVNVRTEIMYAARVRSAMALRAPEECSTFASGATGRHLLVGQNWDWAPFAADTLAVLRAEPDDGPSYVTVVEAGLLAKLGVNSAGLALMTNALGSSEDVGDVGVPYHSLLRAMLDCGSVDEALKRLDGSVRASSANYLLADESGAVVDVEARPGDGSRWHRLDRDDRGVLLHTNHFVAPEFDAIDYKYLVVSTTDDRLERLGQMVDDSTDLGELATFEAALTDHANAPASVCRHTDHSLPGPEQSMTVASALVDLTDRRLFVAEGPPCEHPFEPIAWPGSPVV